MLLKNKILLFLFLLFSIIGFSYAVFSPRVGPGQDKAVENFQKGLSLFNDYKYTASTDFFLKSLSNDPEFFLARRFLGHSLYLSGRVDEAVQEWKIILDNGNYDPPLTLHLQNLSSININSEKEFVFMREINPESGYNFTYPTFISSLPNKKNYLLSLGQLNVGNMIILNPNGDFSQNLRRISEKIQIPIAAAHEKNILWVTDFKADIIHRLDLNSPAAARVLNFLEPVGKKGSGNLEFHGPAGICGYKDNFFIADSGNNRIQKISADGSFIISFDEVASGFKLNNPFGIACTSEGKIYVSEPNEGRLSLFDEFGNFLGFWGERLLKRPRHVQIDAKGEYLIVTDEKEGVILINLKTNELKQIKNFTTKNGVVSSFIRPYSASLDYFGNLFVTDYGAHKVFQFVPEQFLHSNLEVWIERIYEKSFPKIGIYVSVKDQYGNILNVLNSDNFNILENNADVGRVGTSYLNQFKIQGSYTILLSRSSYMKNYTDTLNWVTDFITKSLRQKDSVKVISYEDTYREDSKWTNSRLEIHKALRLTEANDYKSNKLLGLGKALYHSISQTIPKKGKRALIWVTEGLLSDSGLSEINLSRIEQYAINNHIPIYVISFENNQNINYKEHKERIKNLAEKTGGFYFSAFSQELKQIENYLKDQEEKRYVITYESGASKDWKGRFMDVKVRVNFQKRIGIENSGYFIPNER
ncbi:MAG: NHL repeat-containing protein [Spirochaetia bacterium]|nr:NHL repeat-containing protein [Spirochaetia bacterium]